MLSPTFLFNNRRWLGAGFLLAMSSGFGQTYFIALFSGHLREAFALSHGGFGGLYTIATMTSAGVLIWLGKLADTQPFARLGALTIIGLALTCLAMAAVVSPLMLVFVLFGLRFFGQGMLSHIAFTAMGRWYDAERGRALAVAGMGFPAAEALFPFAAVTIAMSIGWRETWVASACVLLGICLPVTYWMLLKERTPRAASPREREETGSGSRDWTRSEVLRDPLFYGLMPGLLAPPFILTGFFFHQVHLAETKAWSLTVIAASFPIYSLASVCTSLALGWAVDKWSAGRLLPFYLLPMAVGLMLVSLTKPAWIVPIFMILAGMTGGGAMTLIGALWAEIYGTRHLGAIRALAVAAMVCATGLAPGIMGVLIDHEVGLESQLFVSSLYTFAAAALFLAISLRTARLTKTASA